MAIKGWYYLHTNGELLYKPELGLTADDLRESDFVVAFWPVDPDDRQTAWTILVEGLAAGADRERIAALAIKWGCDDKDAMVYGDVLGLLFGRGLVIEVDDKPHNVPSTPPPTMKNSQWFVTRLSDAKKSAESHDEKVEIAIGYGNTPLLAMVDLAKILGYQPSKLWGVSFKDLVQETEKRIHLA